MLLSQQIQIPEPASADDALVSRKPYRKPALEKLGELRTLTLGGSVGTGDSGAGSAVEFPPADMPGFPPPDSFNP